MPKTIKTFLFCFVEHKGLIEDIRKQFTDLSKYDIVPVATYEDLIKQLEERQDYKLCKVTIIGLHDSKEQFEKIDQLTREIKKNSTDVRFILIGPSEKIDEIKKIIRFNIEAYIPQNENSMIRLHNAVKKVISEYNIGIYRKKKIISVYITAGFILFCILLLIFSFFRLHQYF